MIVNNDKARKELLAAIVWGATMGAYLTKAERAGTYSLKVEELLENMEREDDRT